MTNVKRTDSGHQLVKWIWLPSSNTRQKRRWQCECGKIGPVAFDTESAQLTHYRHTQDATGSTTPLLDQRLRDCGMSLRIITRNAEAPNR